MATDQIVIILVGAVAGGFVNGLTGFGTALTAIGLWLYALPPPVAATLAILCSVVSQLQTLPVIWHAIEWRRVLPFILPGFAGVPIGTLLVSKVDAQAFKIGVGLFLVLYAAYALIRKDRARRVGAARSPTASPAFAAAFSAVSPAFPVRRSSCGPTSAATPRTTGEACCRPSTSRSSAQR